MLVAIISDIHDNLENLGRFCRWCAAKKIDSMICCGDLTNGETLHFLADNFIGPIHLVRGNIELYDEAEISGYENIQYYGEIGKIKIGNQTVGFCHEPFKIDRIIYNQERNKEKIDYIFYGHTHKPWTEERSRVKLFNPGTLGGVFQRATFAVWDTSTETVELRLLESI